MNSDINVPLTESILQKLYKSKTYVRDGQWDILWHLGGKNNVVIGEKSGSYFLLPQAKEEIVTDLLPFELIQGKHTSDNSNPIPIKTIAELKKYFPEFKEVYISPKLRMQRNS